MTVDGGFYVDFKDIVDRIAQRPDPMRLYLHVAKTCLNQVRLAEGGHHHVIEVTRFGDDGFGQSNVMAEESAARFEIVDDGHKPQGRAVQTDVDELSHVTRAVQHDARRAVREGLLEARQLAPDAIAGRRVQTQRVFQRIRGATRHLGGASRRQQVVDMIRAYSPNPNEALLDEPANERVRQAEGNPRVARQTSLRYRRLAVDSPEDFERVSLVISRRHERNARTSRLRPSQSHTLAFGCGDCRRSLNLGNGADVFSP